LYHPTEIAGKKSISSPSCTNSLPLITLLFLMAMMPPSLMPVLATHLPQISSNFYSTITIAWPAETPHQ
jgi:hypothetical protein